MKKALLTLIALAMINSAEAKEKVPLDIVTKGVHPLEEAVLKNLTMETDTFDLYYDCKFPKGPKGWAEFTKGEKADTSYSSLKLFMPKLPKGWSPWGFFRSLVTIDISKHYRSISTIEDTLYALNQNTYKINGVNLILFWNDLIRSVREDSLDYYSHEREDKNIIKEVRAGEDSCEVKRMNLRTKFCGVYHVYGDDYAFVRFTNEDGYFDLQSSSFFVNLSLNVPWIYLQLRPYPDIRAVGKKYNKNKDPFYEIFKKIK